jgi:hypothetical protein
MNRGEHIFIGIVIFFVYNFLNNSIINGILQPIFSISVTGNWLIGVILAVMGSVVPDFIEPASHWTHRGVFHSKKMLQYSTLFFLITGMIGLFSVIFYYFSCLALGYMFHLIADSTTKMGLPDA